MVNIPEKYTPAFTASTVLSINGQKIQSAFSSANVSSINKAANSTSSAARSPISSGPVSTEGIVTHSTIPMVTEAPVISPIIVPQFYKEVFKGQKVPLSSDNSVTKIKAILGWNVINPQCDVDVSAFLLDETGKAPGDSWFVFYGQPESPDKSTVFSDNCPNAREVITIDLVKLNPAIKKIVFVLTINEAFEKKLNFSMLKDTYLQLLDANTGNELCSYPISDYYSNISSMMIGEVYIHNNNWKFNAVGNGVAKDLAGLCQIYGIQIC